MINHTLAQGILDFYNELGKECFQCSQVDSLPAAFDLIIPKTMDYVYEVTNFSKVNGVNVFDSLYLMLELLCDDIKFVNVIDHNKAAKDDDLEQLKLLALTLYQLAIIDTSLFTKTVESLSPESIEQVAEFISFFETPWNWPQEQQWAFLLYSKERQSLAPSEIEKENYYAPRQSLTQTPMGWRKPAPPSSTFTSRSRARSMYAFTPARQFNSSFANSPLMDTFNSPSFEAKKELRKVKNAYNKVLKEFEDSEKENSRMNDAFTTMKRHLTDKIVNLEKQLSTKTFECTELSEQIEQLTHCTEEMTKLREDDEKLCIEIDELRRENVRLSNLNSSNKDKIWSLKEEVRDKKQRIISLEKDLIEKDEKLFQEMDKYSVDLDNLRQENMELQEKANDLKERNDGLINDKQRLKEELREERTNSHEQQCVIRDHYNEKIGELDKKISAYILKESTLLSENETLRIKLFNAEENEKDLMDQIKMLEDKLVEKEQLISNATHREELLTTTNTRISLKLKSLESNKEAAEERCQELTRKYNDLMKEKNLCTSEDVINEQVEELETLKKKIEKYEEEKDKYLLEIEDMKEEIKILEDEKKSWYLFKDSGKNFFSPINDEIFNNHPSRSSNTSSISDHHSSDPMDNIFDSESLAMFANSVINEEDHQELCYTTEMDNENIIFISTSGSATQIWNITCDTFTEEKEDEDEYQTATQFLQDSRNSCAGSLFLESIAEEDNPFARSLSTKSFHSKKLTRNPFIKLRRRFSKARL
uniref:DUF5745 domain-containing protein n=1 Tax=Parastrongyloides trichosuri TaxID=131310 RepID=A0A0N4ZID9_PARTI